MKVLVLLFSVLISSVEAQEVKGALDLYWGMNSQKNQTGSAFTNLPHNDVGIGLATLNFEGSSDKVDYFIELAYGDQAGLAASGATTAKEGLSQAYISRQLTEELSIHAGRMDVRVGYENNFAINNVNYSRSLGFTYGGPNFGEGVALRYKKNNLELEVYYMDGPDQLDNTESTNAYSFLANYELAKWSLIYGYFSEQDGTNSSFHDVSISYEFISSLTMTFNALIGALDEENIDGEWSSMAIYLNYDLSESSYLALRLEAWEQEDITLIGTNTDEEVTSATLTYGFDLQEDSELRAEFRYDSADNEIFRDDEGANKDSQSNISLAWLTSF